MLKDYKRITYYDNCTGCFACEVACKQEHGLPVGPRWIQVSPDVREVDGQWKFNYFVTECHRAATPPCRVACPADGWLMQRESGVYQLGRALLAARKQAGAYPPR